MGKTLSSICKLQGGYAYKSVEFTTAGIPVVKIGDVTGGGSLNYEGMQRISRDAASSTAKFKPEARDTLIAMTGANVGRTIRVGVGEPDSRINQRVGRFITLESENYPKDYIYYLVSNNTAYHYFKNAAYGSAQPNISGKVIEDLPIPHHERHEARAIANVLSALDDKIELNRRTNETLEVMAQAIFKDWFVDFGPVRRKQAGETNPTAILGGLIPPSEKTTQTAALFPDTFGDNGLPKGWRKKPLTKIADVKQGAYIAKSELETKQTKIKAVPVHGANGIRGWTKKAHFREGVALLTCRGSNCGLVLWADGPLWVSNNAMSITRKDRSNFFCYYLVTNDPPYDVVSGSAQPQITATALSSRFYIAPTEAVIRAFDVTVSPFKNNIFRNLRQNQTLAQTRDYLLPKLMSGQVRAGHAQSMVA